MPYCFVYQVDWDKCEVGKVRVARDLLYIFFVLKMYPENYSASRLYLKPRNEWAYYYGSIYDAYQRGRLEKKVCRPEYSVLFSRKDITETLCKGFGIPHVHSMCLVEPGSTCIETIRSCLVQANDGKLIVKGVEGSGGNNVKTVYLSHGREFVEDMGVEYPLADLVLDIPHVVQEFVEQHGSLSQFHPASLNTLRLITLRASSENIIIATAGMKFGVGGMTVDNVSRGGLGVDIDKHTGVIRGDAWDINGTSYPEHPDSNIRFNGFQLPEWKSVIDLCQLTHRNFGYSIILGMDIALTPNGPLLVEINRFPDTIIEERVHGPFFKFREIWEVFRDNDLLINKPSKLLY